MTYEKTFPCKLNAADAPTFEFLAAHGIACTTAGALYDCGEWNDLGIAPRDAPSIIIRAFDGDVSADLYFAGDGWIWVACGFDVDTGEYTEASGEERHLFGAIREILRQGPFFGNELSATLSEARDYGARAIVYGR